jgi:hypothetical protein
MKRHTFRFFITVETEQSKISAKRELQTRLEETFNRYNKTHIGLKVKEVKNL